MKNALPIITESLKDDELISAILSSKKEKTSELKSVTLQSLNEESFKVEFRFTKHNDIKTMSKSDFLQDFEDSLINQFKQIHIKTASQEIQVLINKKGKATVLKKQAQEQKSKSHNRKKAYLIPDGEVCDFLVEIGVMSKNGKVKPTHYKKFKQINRFLEMVDDLFKDSPKKNIHAVDFGCGKSYLTFALYYYFNVLKGISAKITGIDLKQEVIDNCNTISKKLNYSQLNFVHGFIHDFKTQEAIDFVVTLHACDTATDDAILFSLQHKAQSMMFVPCCQHELNKQLKNEQQSILIDSGLFRDKVCSLVTDTMRAKLLEACGYKVQIMEFIETEHTAKNVLLRCKLSSQNEKIRNKKLMAYQDFAKSWDISPYLEKELKAHGFIA